MPADDASGFPPDDASVPLAEAQRAHAAGLMRVNHVGEVCAQALYRSQAAATDDPALAAYLADAAAEELEHLRWTAARLGELRSRPSRLVPLWHAGASGIGFVAGLAGDRASLGFMAETERQVEAHLDGHLERLPAGDRRSRAIVARMKADEARHATGALARGGRLPPRPVRALMRAMARVMTTTAYRY
ncbi:MAG: 2-polyprenyl-3-methyl-6-methoxy-1,4-benzoquinone monooxygenase [Lautropia sp.]